MTVHVQPQNKQWRKKEVRKVVIFMKEVMLPVVVATLITALCKRVIDSGDGCFFLYLWIFVGFPFGISRLKHFVIPIGHDLGAGAGIWFLNIMLAGVVGVPVLVTKVIKGMYMCLTM